MADKFETKMEGQNGVIVVDTDLDNEEAGKKLEESFNELLNNGTKVIVLDLRNVEIINSFGVGKIITCLKIIKAKNDGRQLMLKPLQGFVKETFDLLMLTDLFPIDNTN